ncbi:hypothetical protein K432DRAFT_180757 [Lepidopterella palustris CBS 459.81]|uniref:Uncharacterized protein n=1 Tax=Lepidopterella palustris CBS 459.81 TaxID=1314670 RepID=A0A8E2E0D0_9PEZI|nr:hypothetical protein K432DRAFT_180757 [Lepidopterella palustris CBS 459.81]
MLKFIKLLVVLVCGEEGADRIGSPALSSTQSCLESAVSLNMLEVGPTLVLLIGIWISDPVCLATYQNFRLLVRAPVMLLLYRQLGVN